MRRIWTLVFAASLAGCAWGSPPPRDPSALDAYAASFTASEPLMLRRATVADPRLFARFLEPGEPLLYADPFFFDTREAALDALEEAFLRAALSFPPGASESPRVRELRDEQASIRRFIVAERARVESERRSPARAMAGILSGLLRVRLVTTDDNELAWRLGLLRESLQANAMSAMERDDVDDALAALDARFGPRAKKTRRALRELRRTVDALIVAPLPLDSFEEVRSGMVAFLGADHDPAWISSELSRVLAVLDEQIHVARSVLGPARTEALSERARALVVAADDDEAPCAPPSGSGYLRGAPPPPERAPLGCFVAALAASERDEDEIVATIALRDGAALASRALAMLGDVRDPQAAAAAFPLVSAADRDPVLARHASTRATAWLGVGIAASVLLERGPARLVARARRWRAYGDAPLDLVAPAL